VEMTQTAASLSAAAKRAMAAGDFATAKATLSQLLQLDRNSIPIWLNLAAVCRQLNDVNGAYGALREVLKLDARNFPALLMLATLMEREGRTREAAVAYGPALANAPPDEYLDPATLQAVT